MRKLRILSLVMLMFFMANPYIVKAEEIKEYTLETQKVEKPEISLTKDEYIDPSDLLEYMDSIYTIESIEVMDFPKETLKPMYPVSNQMLTEISEENEKKLEEKLEEQKELNRNEPITPSEEDIIANNRWGIYVSDEDMELIARIVTLEAGNQSDEGKQAVVEVILNRVAHDSFPDTIEGVLSSPGQFSTWKNRYISKAEPTEETYECVSDVINGDTELLSDNTVFFAGAPHNNKIEMVIGGHYFCRKE